MAPSAESIAANEVDVENDKSSKLEARIAHLESLLQQLGQGVLGAKSLAPIDTVEKVCSKQYRHAYAMLPQ